MGKEKKVCERINSLQNEFSSREQIESRYYLDEYTSLILQRDSIRFTGTHSKKYSNSYLCRIIMNYLHYIHDKNLEDQFLKTVIREITRFSRHTDGKSVIHGKMTFQEKMKKEILSIFFSPAKVALLSQGITAEKFSHFKPVLISCALEKFANLPFSERELVFCYEHFNIIMAAREAGAVLKITYNPRTEPNPEDFEVKPFDVKLDENSASHYLIGYSRKLGTDNPYEGCTFKLSRIKECELTRKQYILNKSEIDNLKKQYQRYGASYVFKQADNDQVVTVRLSKYGYENLYLRIVAHQRPLPVNEQVKEMINEKLYYILEFNCSYEQIRNYFFSFGAEAEILSPEPLRVQFKEELAAALNLYAQNSENAD